MKIAQNNLPIFIGHKCNYSCVNCSVGSDFVKNYDNDPTLEEILHSIPVLAEKFTVTGMISLTGGEPFMYWDEKIIPLAQELNRWFPGTRINVFTNGHLIGKNIEKMFELIDQIKNISFTVSRHLIGNLDSAVGKAWQSSINTLLDHPRLVRIHNDHYHVINNIAANIYFYTTKYWNSHYVTQPDGRIKPHATNNPEDSMKHGCIGSTCSYLHGTKLYKCGRLATLSTQLTELNQLDNPSWKKYLKYQPIDLLNIDQSLFDNFINTYGKPIDLCDMCNGTPSDIEWQDRTWTMVFQPPTKSLTT
jgi:organic radical activating enzyme